MTLIYWAIPFFLSTVALEWALTRRRNRAEGAEDRRVRGYRPKDAAASIGMGLGYLGIAFFTKVGVLAIFTVVYEHRLFDLPADAVWVWALLIVAEDLCYYVFHRTSHGVRFLWAAHINHHSSTHYNLSTALRQSWTGALVSWVFWLPLPLLGFHPLMVFAAQSISLLYQYWIHTELIGRLGPLEALFNTPSHHRVHHGSNPRYLDRNHAGIFIVWDRLFGTFEPERERPEYGLTTNIHTHNLIVIAFHEWAAMLRDVARARTLRGRLGYLFAPPGWREDGTGKTAAVVRREAIAKERPAAPAP